MEKTLPTKYSELLRLAVSCLVRVEKDENYEITMRTYHSVAPESGRTNVCFAGCVMAKYFNVNRHKDWGPSYFLHPIEGQLIFLDKIREYECPTIFRKDDAMYEIRQKMSKLNQLSYEKNPRVFKNNMLKLANIIEEQEK